MARTYPQRKARREAWRERFAVWFVGVYGLVLQSSWALCASPSSVAFGWVNGKRAYVLLHAPEHASPSNGQQLDPVYAKQATANQGHFIYHRCGSGTLTETTLQHVELTPTMGRQYRRVCTFERQQPYAEPEAAQKDRKRPCDWAFEPAQRNVRFVCRATFPFGCVSFHLRRNVAASVWQRWKTLFSVLRSPLGAGIVLRTGALLYQPSTGRYGTPFMRTKHTFSLRLHILQPIWRNILRCRLWKDAK